MIMIMIILYDLPPLVPYSRTPLVGIYIVLHGQHSAHGAHGAPGGLMFMWYGCGLRI